MAATAESITERTIRVYCPIHKVGFDASANRTILCSSQKHALADAFPNEAFWEYCCDCQHCWLIDISKVGAASDECAACERAIVRRFICASCKVISIESDNPARRKAFSISSQGTPNPTCPGCLKRPSTKVLDHECTDLGVTFFTTFSNCPFCDEPLEAPPDFPCFVSHFLANVRAATTTLKFDSESNTLLESPVGDYVLIPRVRGAHVPIVVPRTSRFSSKRDYYDAYYEVFNCDNPKGGEVVVLSPAIVEKSEFGWQIREPGFLEVKSDEIREAATSSQSSVICENCGTVGTSEHAFCKRCGLPLRSSVVTAPIDETFPVGAPFSEGRTYPEHSQSSGPYANTFTPTSQVASAAGAAATTATIDSLDRSGASQTLASPGITTTTSNAPKVVLGIVAGVFLLVVIVAIAMMAGGNSIEKKLDYAIARQNLFGPSSDNAYGLYNQLKSSGASEETLKRYREKLTPLLTSRGYQLASDLVQIGYDEPDASEWQEAGKNLDWAVELNPGNSYMSARAAYCSGRAAFLQKQNDQALTLWTKAASLEKSWALPVNGIGLIYNSRRDYASARSYFVEAIRRDPNWPVPYENMGNAYYMEKNRDNARNFYNQALEKSPNWAKPHVHLADMALEDKDYATAVSEFESALGSNAKGLKGQEITKVQERLEIARQRLSGGNGY